MSWVFCVWKFLSKEVLTNVSYGLDFFKEKLIIISYGLLFFNFEKWNKKEEELGIMFKIKI
jgi:hypothetical protein